MVNTAELIEKLSGIFGAEVSFQEGSDLPVITVKASRYLQLAKTLKEEFGYTFLTDLCGIHYPDNDLPFGVVVHLHNLPENSRIRVKTFTAGKKPELDSLIPVYPGANWMERETFDFYGIHFKGHPDLRRILNVEYMDYHPMRKEYPLEDPTREDKDDRYFGR